MRPFVEKASFDPGETVYVQPFREDYRCDPQKIFDRRLNRFVLRIRRTS